MIQTTTIEQLKPGHEYPGESVNSRTAYRDAEIERLAASLQHDGQLYPLLVCSHPESNGALYVVDGNRRRVAFQTLVESGALEAGFGIEVRNLGEIAPSEALRKSLASNETVPLHPADRYEVFARLNSAGADPKEIAGRYGMAVRAVEQSLALGSQLAPEVLDAWRSGDINAELARIFTLADKEDQVAQLEKARESRKKAWGENRTAPLHEQYQIEHTLRKAFTGNEEDAARLLKFVGEDAYIAAGGRIAKDLFGEKETTVVQDMAKLKKLANAKLQKKADQLTEEGWSWAEVSTAPHFNDWNFGKSQDKKKAGCVVRIAGTKIEVKSGLTKKEKGASGYSSGGYSNAPREEPLEGWTAQRAISSAMSEGAVAALQKNRKLTLAAFLASIATDGGDDPRFEFSADDLGLTNAKKFDGALDEFLKLNDDKAIAILAQGLAGSIYLDDECESKLLKLFDQPTFQQGIRDAFDPKAYFGDCSVKHLLKCIEEALGPDDKRQNEKKDKAALAKFCIASVAPTGWLPKQLRTSEYKAPDRKAATPAPKTKAKPKAAPPPKKKA